MTSIEQQIQDIEQELQSVLDLEQQEANEQARREQVKQDAQAKLKELRYRQAMDAFERGKATNEQLVVSNQQAIAEFNRGIKALVKDIDSTLQGLGDEVMQTYHAQQEHAQNTLNVAWKGKHDYEYSQRLENVAVHSASLHRLSLATELRNARDIHSVLSELARLEPDTDKRRIFYAIRYILTGDGIG